MEHAGNRHVFCSEACLGRFLSDPERFLATARTV
jgi:YHS domain-containing protein